VSAAELYDLVAAQVVAAPSLLYVIPTLRDPRWLELAIGSAPMTRALLTHIARDPENAAGDLAVERLVAQSSNAGDVIDRRAALTALGDTGRPSAAPALLAAFADPTIGSAMDLVLKGIGRCAGLDAIPILESQSGGRWNVQIESAIAAIRARAATLSRHTVFAACAHPDPVVANLAQQARDGDVDALVVLQDALRERGQLL
jgi:hypothetical protein